MTEEFEQDPGKLLAKLNGMYTDADSADKTLFAEQRSNILLYIGQHYNQKDSALRSYVRDLKDVEPQKKLRLTKNHLGIVCDRLMNYTITGHSPDVVIQEKHKMEVQDRQAAKVAQSVWNKIKDVNKFSSKIDDFAFDFIVAGEMAAFVSFNPNKGDIVHQEVVDEVTGEVVGRKRGFTGEVDIERWESFNLLRDPQVKNWEESSYYIYRKMDDVATLKSQFKGNDEIVEKLTKSSEETFTVFDAQKGSYALSGKDKVLTKMFLYRPCEQYPDGYYITCTSDVILTQGSLNGIWPLIYRPYTKASGSPRGYSIIKRLRPSQAEINRIGSSIAESQLNFKDRLIIQNGSKITNGGNVAGAQAIRVSGAAPQIMQGQSGDKYLSVLSHSIDELYQLANLTLEEEERIPNTDPNALLFASLKHKKKFTQKSSIFESFLVELCEVAIETAKLFYHDAHIIEAIDKKDYINIQEFKNISKISYSLEAKSSSGDVDSVLGQQMAIQHALQYASLPPAQAAMLVSNMPYLKDSAMAQEITADFRACEDIFAAIERGEYIEVSKYENHDYMTKKITNRMKESSFRYLAPNIQQMFQQRLQSHDQFLTQKAEALQRAEMGLIPSGGALIPVALYMDANNASKRVRLPHDALEWLYKKLYEQGGLRDELMGQNDGNIIDLGNQTQPMDMLSQQMSPNFNTQHLMPNPTQPVGGA